MEAGEEHDPVVTVLIDSLDNVQAVTPKMDRPVGARTRAGHWGGSRGLLVL